MEQKGLFGLAILLVVIALLFGSFSAYALMNQPVAATIEKEVLVQVPYNDSAVKADLEALKAEMLKDVTWKAAAEELAATEGPSKKDVYDFLVDNSVAIEERADIKSIVEIESDVDSFDVDEKDAVVIKEYKVIYEDQNEVRDVKEYLIVTSEIVDGEVEDQVIEFR